MIIRVSKEDNRFAQIDNRPLHDNALSWKAKGMLAYLLSKPDNWKVRVTDLIRQSADGEASVRAGLKELQEAGYLIVKQERGEDGRWLPTEYTVFEYPPHSDNPNADNPNAEKDHSSYTDSTDTDVEKDYPTGHTPGETAPTTFPEWLLRVNRSTNKPGMLRYMFGVLFPGRDPPDYPYIGRVAKTVGGSGRLAELMWTASARPPTGDPLRFCMGIAKGQRRRQGNGKQPANAPGDSVEVQGGKRVIKVGQ